MKVAGSGSIQPSMTISALAGTISGTVSQGTSSTGAPLIAPITSYSEMSRGTGAPAVKPSEGSHPSTKATGIFSPLASYFVKCPPQCWARHIRTGIVSLPPTMPR